MTGTMVALVCLLQAGTFVDRMTPERAERDCLAQPGSDCDSQVFISKPDALRIARQTGMAEGLKPWRVYVTYSARHGAPIWVVENTLARSGDGSSGSMLAIHATNGGILGRSMWGANIDSVVSPADNAGRP